MNLILVALIILSFILGTLPVFLFMNVCFEARTTESRHLVLSYLFFIVLTSLQQLLIMGGMFLGANFLSYALLYSILFFIITLNYKSTLAKRAFVAFYAFLSWDLSIAIASNLVVVHIFHFVGFLESGSALFHIVSRLAGIVVFYFFAFLLRRFTYIKKDVIDITAFWGLALLLGFAIVSMGMIYISSGRTFGTAFALTNMFTHAFVIFLVFYLYNTLARTYEDKLAAAIYVREKEYYLSQCEIMQESVKKVRSIRHDMNFHLAAIKEFSMDSKSATDYINRLLGDISEGDSYSNSGNIAFDSIINYKFKTAAENNIMLDLSLLIPPVLNIEIADVVTILGNLIDNALDAVAKVDDKTIKLDIEFSKSCLFIRIDNSFDGTIKYAEGKSEKEKCIATLKTEGEHGYGLENIRKSVEKYNGYVDITHFDNIFSVGIVLYVDNPHQLG